jgi:hypothetical protein
MIYFGDRMGLYQALNGAGPMTSEELAGKTGLDEQWIRECLMGQAAADLISLSARRPLRADDRRRDGAGERGQPDVFWRADSAAIGCGSGVT